MDKIKCLLATMCMLAGMASAQTFTGTIVGTVHDSSGALVPSAKVTILNTATNARSVVESNSQGYFSAPLLPPGTYKLEVAAAGFKTSVQEGIVLQVQQSINLDFVLTLGEVTESVVVTAEAPLLESTASSVGKVVDNRNIINLPLNTRNVYSLIFLTPGVTGRVGINYDDMRYSVNGGRQRMLDTLVDGVAASHPTVNGAGGVSVFPSVDAIEEFKVMGANPPAEFGRSQGSVLNVVFKSGGNRFHGSAYEFLRNSVLDANNFFDNGRGRPLGSFKRSQFGGVLSGPIVPDKTFFLVDYEGLRERSLASSTFTVPTQLERQGDFSQTFAQNGQLIKIFDPFSASSSGSSRTQFGGNKIPPAVFDPVSVNVAKYYPLPNTVGNPITNQNNYSLSGSRQLDLDQFDIRIDHNISQSQRIFGRYSQRSITDAPPAYFPKDLAIAEGRVIQSNDPTGAVFEYTNAISPSTIFTGRLGFARTLFLYANQGLGFLPSSLGLPKEIDSAVDRQMFPRFSTDYVQLGGNDHRRSGFNNYTTVASLTKVSGSHTMKMGFEGRLIRVNVWEARDAGRFNFSKSFTQGPDPTRASSTAGNSFASLLLGTGSSGNLIQAWKNVAAQSFYYAGYFQDDWRATGKLTLNLGVRYDLDTPRTERYNRVNYFDPLVSSPLAQQVPQFPSLQGGLVFVGVNGRDRYQYNMDKNNLAPRVGLAYQLTRKTVIRAAWGNLFGISPQEAQGTVGPFGFRVENTWVTSLDNGISPFNLLRNPFPQGFQPPPGAADGLLTGVGGPIQGVLRDTVTPYSMQWNFTVQRELPGQVLLEAGYVGTRGLQLNRSTESGFDLNQLTTDRLALGKSLNDKVANPFFGIINSGVFVTPEISRSQLLRPYPQFTSIVPLYSSGSSSTYHSLQTSFRKRLSAGLQFEGSYTWAKNLDNGESHQDTYNIRASRALSDLDVAHRFVLSYVYELPFGRGRHFGSQVSKLTNVLLGGWQVNGITTYQSGTPLGISASNRSGLFNPTLYANNNGNSGKLSGPVQSRLNRYFDTGVFSQPDPFTLGNLGPRLPDIRNDGVHNWDLSLFKEFFPSEGTRLQFRAEALNAFNTPQFSSPNTSVTSNSFGVVSSQANAPRQIQFGLKLLW